MFAIILSVVTFVTVSDCYLGVSHSSERWEGLFGRPSVPKNYTDFPDYWDWRDLGLVTPVKNQGDCAACWAFAIVGAIESQRFIHLMKYEILSEQFLIDCLFANTTGTGGCGNAPILQTYLEIIFKYGGVLRDKDYRRYSAQKLTCEYQMPALNSPSVSQPLPVPVYGFKRIDTSVFKEMIMEVDLYMNGPLVARINAASMGKYKGGIDEPTEEDCDPSPESMTHSVLIVGFSKYESADRVIPYWIIKNSWGPYWGMEGYYYLVRGKNACGIANDVSIPIVMP